MNTGRKSVGSPWHRPIYRSIRPTYRTCWGNFTCWNGKETDPCGGASSQAHTTGGRTAKLEQFCLLLVDEAGAATIVLVHTALVDVARREINGLGLIAELKVDRYYCFNAGVGVYPIPPGRTVT